LINQILKFIGYTSTSVILVLFLFYLFYPTSFSRSPSSVTKINWFSSPLDSTALSNGQLMGQKEGQSGVGKVTWQDCEGKTDLATCRWEDFPLMTREQAHNHCQGIAETNQEPWRLPTLAETRFSGGSRIIQTVTSQGLWTSDRVRNYPEYAWVRDVKTGIPNAERRSSLFLVRCVRSNSLADNPEIAEP